MDNANDQFEPPKWADRFLKWYCSDSRLEEIQGDLHELFEYRISQSSVSQAKKRYAWDVIRCCKSYAFRKKSNYSRTNNIDMLKNYFIICLRTLMRHKSYSAINIFGLTLGIVCFTFIFMYVDDELSYDQFHEKKSQIYTVPFTWHFGATVLPTAKATTNVGPMLKERFPEVINSLRITNKGKTTIKNDNFIGEESGVLYADSTFFDFFSLRLMEGDEKTALVEPNSIILTEKLAEKYFGENWKNNSLLDSILLVNGSSAYKITGVIQPLPDNSHLQFNALTSFSSLSESNGAGSYDNSAYMTYILLEEHVNALELESKMHEMIQEEFKDMDPIPIEIGLTPMTDIYLHTQMSTSVGPISDVKYVYIFGLIGLVIIIIACINYMNLATARSVERAKEVGVRKVMGALRKQLTIQFLVESLVITFISIAISLLVIYSSLPFFNALTGKMLSVNLLENTDLLRALCVIWLSVSLLAGVYPALSISGFRVINVLKGSFKNSATGNALRKVLVTFQFAISATLIIGTIVVFQQLQYLQNKNLGFNHEHIISIPINAPVRAKLDLLKNELNQYEQITSVSAMYQTPGNIGFETTIAEKTGEENRHLMRSAIVDKDFIDITSLKLLVGDAFLGTDTSEYEYIINQQTAEFFGWEEDEIVGKRLMVWGGEWGTVKGMVEDFHYASLHEEIKPLVIIGMAETSSMYRNLLVKIKGDNINETIQIIEEKWQGLIPEKPFSYAFLDDEFSSTYDKEQKLSTVFTVFAFIAILIGCLGLFGLASYASVQRSKEIGVRKILGATVTSITLLLSQSFSKQILVALIIALPLAYFSMNEWLSTFAYRINISWYILAFGAVVTIVIALSTVAYRSISAALSNPADTLRSE
jgi:putative ABC transport system permease protein